MIGLAHGDAEHGALFRRYNDAMRRSLALAGADFQYGRRLPADIDALGFDEVGAEARAFPAASEMRALFQLSAEHWRDRLVATGLFSPEDADRAPKVLADPNFHYFGPLCVAVWARAPLS